MLELARSSLAGGGTRPAPLMTADPRALPSLRSDGLLLPAGPQFAFRAAMSSPMTRCGTSRWPGSSPARV